MNQDEKVKQWRAKVAKEAAAKKENEKYQNECLTCGTMYDTRVGCETCKSKNEETTE